EAHLDVVRERVDDDHHAVRRNALISLFKATGTEALPTLLSAADDDSERVREWAVHMLGGIDDERATATLERHAARDASRIVRETARNALDVDADRFRRRFSGTGAGEEVTHRGEDFLNRTPDL
ncbi:MAG: HEAT repeat domain-containing protein, partial [Halanaeroarchaeum sp.]